MKICCDLEWSRDFWEFARDYYQSLQAICSTSYVPTPLWNWKSGHQLFSMQIVRGQFESPLFTTINHIHNQSSPLFCLLLQRMLISWRLSSMKKNLRPILFKSRRKILALSFVLWIINEFGLKYRRFSEIWVDIESTPRILSLNFYAKFSSPFSLRIKRGRKVIAPLAAPRFNDMSDLSRYWVDALNIVWGMFSSP